MLTAYSYIGRFKKGLKINLAKEFAGRYIRIMPPIIAMMLFTAFIFPLLGSGPQWNTIVKPQSDLCHKYWWRNLLLIQNYFGFENICVTHTHHVANDTQLFLVTPFLAFLLWKLNKKGLFYIGGLMVLSQIGRFYVTYTEGISDFLYFGVR
jgi:peptidoglycan/LPS O-acetylase OafA/YrhL